MNVVNTFSHHKQHPQVSYAAHIRAQHIALGEFIAETKKIYLDTKFWLILRDVELGRINDPDARKLLDLLRSLAASGRAVCPISREIFREVFGQSDSTTLTITLKLIDQFSKQICLLDDHTRIEVEIFHFMRSVTQSVETLHPLNHMVWTKAPYALGHVLPVPTNEKFKSNGFDLVVQKAFFDQLWQTSLTEMMEISGGKFRLPPPSDIAPDLNDGKFSHTHEFKSFRDLYLTEVQGTLDACRPAFCNVAQQMYQNDTGNSMTDEDRGDDKPGGAIAGLVYQCICHNKAAGYFPTIRLMAGFHAVVRWDKQRKYKTNDCADFRHAAAAIPYFDYFLTERSLNELLSNGNLKLRDQHKCITVSNAKDALQALEPLSG
jgi:hypothetical protein